MWTPWLPDLLPPVVSPGDTRPQALAVPGSSRSSPEARPAAVRPQIVTSADEANGVVSPDGRWIAYETDDTGRWGIAVRPVAPAGPTATIAASGRAPAWLDARTILYVEGDRVVRVRSRSSSTFDPEPPQTVRSGIGRTWRGTTGDGRLLVIAETRASAPSVTLGCSRTSVAAIAASQPLPAAVR